MASPSTHVPPVERYLARARGGRAALALRDVQVPAQGRNSEVFLITDAAGGRFVLRAFKNPLEGQHYAGLMRRYGDGLLPLPRLLWSDTSLTTRLRYWRCFCAEELIEGSLLMDTGSDARATGAVLRALATLHDESSRHWGDPSRPQSGDIRRHLLGEAQRWVGATSRSSSLLRPGDRERWDAFLRSSAARLPVQTQFSLLHGKLGADDIVVSPGSFEATFIDIGSLSFGHFLHDLLYLLDYLAPDDEADRQQLVERYLDMRKHLPPDFDYPRDEPFFTARHHAKKLWAADRRGGDDELSLSRMRFHYESLNALARSS